MRRLGIAFLLVGLAFTESTSAQQPPTSKPATNNVQPASERSIDAGPAKRPIGSASSTSSTTAGRPAIRGPRIPDALRAQLKAKLDARIEADLSRIRGLRTEAINLLTTFVAETPKESREMPEALMRLGELKWEAERESFVDRFKAWESKPVDQRGPVPEINYKPSRDLFARVLKDYTWFDQYDLALYVDGFLATEQGKEEEALERFERILKDFPRSRFIPDAHMAKAEAKFNGKYDYAGALAEYEEVLKFPNSDLFGLALFKSAWCYWRLGNNDEAARRFVKVFEVTDTGQRQVTAQQRKQLDELQGEALKYLVEVFTEDERNTAQDLYGFLQKIGGDRFAGKIVRALADQFYDQAHYERGIEAYELLLKLEPTSREAGLWVLQIAAGWAQLENYPKLKASYERAATGYTPGSGWAKSQGDQANVAATNQKIEAQLYNHATQLHAKAQKDRTSRAEFEGAVGLYEVYLTKFDKEPRAYLVHFYAGEIDFFRLGNNLDAATHYMAAARSIPDASAKSSRDIDKLRHDALLNTLTALRRARETKGKVQPGQEGEADKKFGEALELFATLYKDDPALPELFYNEGRAYYEAQNYDAAVKVWGSLLEKFPSSDYARTAGESILASFDKAKNYENIETWARRLKTAPAFQNPSYQTKLNSLIVIAVFQQGAQKAQANDHAGAAAAYLRAAKEFPNDSRAAQACVNAETEAQKAGDLPTLKEAATLVMGKDYRDKPESPLGAWTASKTLVSMGLFADAAEVDEQMMSLNDRDHPNYQKYDHTKDAAFNAVMLREAIGEHDRAIVDGNKYLSQFGSSPEADEVYFQMGKAHSNAGRPRDAAELYKRYLSRSKNADHRAQGLVLLAEAQIKNGDEKGADSSLSGAVDIGKHHKSDLGPEGKYAAAKARYMEGERVLAQFEKIQIQGDVKQLSARLKQKTELLKQSATIFLDCVSMGVAEWTTAALYQIGRTYELFAKSLRESPAPPGLSEADKQQYQSTIEENVVPIEERSLDAYENGWKKAVELGIYNQWTAKMREALGRLNTELYSPFKETGFDVRSQGPAPLPALIEAPRRGGPPAQAASPSAPKK